MGTFSMILHIILLCGFIGLYTWVVINLNFDMHVGDEYEKGRYGGDAYKYDRRRGSYVVVSDMMNWLTTKGGWAVIINNLTGFIMIGFFICGLMVSNGVRREMKYGAENNFAYAPIAQPQVVMHQQPQATVVQTPQQQPAQTMVVQQPPQTAGQTTVVVTQ